MLLEQALSVFDMWLDTEKLEFSVTPRHFSSDTLSTSGMVGIVGRSVFFVAFGLKKIISLDFDLFSLRLFEAAHSST